MVCKEDVISWFKTLRSNNRIDVMCALLNLCLPYELRFLGTCLEDLGKRDFHDFRKTEKEANNFSDSEIECISDKRTRTKLALYISLLRPCNYSCCNSLFKILTNFDEVNTLLKSPAILTPDDSTLEELLLIYTIALNHPAFSFEQKLMLGDIFTKIQQEENKRSTLNQPRSLNNSSGIDSVNDKLSPQSCPVEDRHVHNTVSNTSHCPAPLNSVVNHLPGDPVLNLHDPLSSGSYHVRLAAAYQPTPLLGNHANWPSMMLPPEPTTSPSPLVCSRTSSPCQSNSPSRAGSPGRPKPSLTGPFSRPPPIDPLRETIGKEMPNYLPNLQDYSIDQLRQMGDEEFRELGLPNGAVYQLRSIVNKLQATNGITNLIDVPPNNNNNNKKKLETSEHEMPVIRRYANIVETPHAMMFTMAPPPLNYVTTCFGCLSSTPRPHKSIPPNIFCLNEQMRSLNLDPECPNSLHGSNSSASDSASDHSPPDTPSLSTISDRGSLKEHVEVWNGGDEREQRVGMPTDNLDERRLNNAHPNSQQQQQPRSRGIGRSRSNPPGIQTLPRGRGPHLSAQRRRDMTANVTNGVPDDRKAFGGNEIQPFPYTPGAPAPTPYIPHTHFVRAAAAAAAAYPAFHPNSYVRPSYPFPHPNSGEMVYQYPPPSQTAFLPPGPAPAPQPAPITYSNLVPPPKISCYNCGSQSHLASDCQESTIEEISKQGQYRIDYTPYQKSGECSSTNNSDK